MVRIMCGIAGIWNRTGENVERATLERMSATIRHRGPDGSGVFVSGDLGLAHRRLRIIDLSELGHQPMGTPDGRYWITFNGEMHNFVELRTELEAKGVAFHSRTDTEVALQAYLAWGPSCFEKFNGMWALAIWDDVRRLLLLSRDRFGIKPLVYSENGRRFAFASEAKAILEIFPEERRPDFAELNAYLAGAFPDCSDATFFAGIRSLPAGHSLFVYPDRTALARHWNFAPGAETPRADAEEQFRHLLTDSVRLRMRSDVPVSAALSGGLDSSVVTLLAGKFADRPVECFSLNYDKKKHDESGYATAAIAGGADQFHLNWVRPAPEGFVDRLAKIAWHHDAPPASRGRYPCWFLMDDVGRQGRVLLTGEGGDELLGGYSRFILPYLLDRATIGIAHRATAGLVAEFRALKQEYSGAFGTLRRMLSTPVMQRTGARPWPHVRVLHPDIARLQPPVPRNRYADWWTRPEAPRPYRSRLNNALWHEFTFAGLPEILHGNDAISMAFSVEVRQPFLDHRLVEFCFSLAYDEKIRNGWLKSLLRRSFSQLLPPAIRDRRTKFGFAVPLREWMMRDDNFRDARSRLLDGTCVAAGIFAREQLEKKIAAARRGGTLYKSMEPFWRWVSTELWYRQFIAKS